MRHYNATSGKSRKEGRCHGKGAYSVKCLRNLNKNRGLEKLPEQRSGWTRLSQSTGPPSRVPLGHRATQSLHSRGSDLGFPGPRARASSCTSHPAVHKRWTSPHTTTSMLTTVKVTQAHLQDQTHAKNDMKKGNTSTLKTKTLEALTQLSFK